MALPEPYLSFAHEPADGTPWQGAAFGLCVEGEFAAPGLSGGPADESPGAITLELGDVDALSGVWTGDDARRLGSTKLADGTEAIVADFDPGRGFLLSGPAFGRYYVAADGRTAICAPADGAPAWLWQRFVIGQVLPVSAILQGLEVLHAAGLEVDGRTIAVAGLSGVGKSTTALHLMARGARFLADDVVALEPRGEQLQAHPGTRLVSAPDGAEAFLGGDRLDSIGEEIGATDKEVLLRPAAQAPGGPLTAVYILVRTADGPLAVESVADVRLLIACGYDGMLTDPSRHLRFLDVCSRLSVSGAAHRVSVPPSAHPNEVADTILRHLGGAS